MRSAAIPNLRIALIQRHHFGPVGCARRSVTLAGRPVRMQGLSAVISRKIARADRVECGRPRPEPAHQPLAWPYDTAWPTGFTRLPEGPGVADNTILKLGLGRIPTSNPVSTDQMGSIVDLIV